MFLFVTGNIRRKRIQIEDSIFWVIFSISLLVVAIFPQIVGALADLIGVLSPSNLVFLVVIAVLTAKLFTLTISISSLKHKINELAQEEALLSQDHDGDADPKR